MVCEALSCEKLISESAGVDCLPKLFTHLLLGQCVEGSNSYQRSLEAEGQRRVLRTTSRIHVLMRRGDQNMKLKTQGLKFQRKICEIVMSALTSFFVTFRVGGPSFSPEGHLRTKRRRRLLRTVRAHASHHSST